MGRYGLILGPIEAYTQNIAIGTIVDPMLAHKKYTKIKKTKTYISSWLRPIPPPRLTAFWELPGRGRGPVFSEL